MLQNKSIFEMLFFINLALIKYSYIQLTIILLIRFTQSFIFAFFKIEKLIFHIHSLFIFNNNYLIILIMSFILKSAHFFDIYFFIKSIMHLQTMNFKLLCIFKRYKFLGQTVLITADIM